MIDWTDRDEARDLVIARAPFANADEVDALLELSSGRDPDEIQTFRPYVVLASIYQTQFERYRQLSGASGASLEYNDPDEARIGYLRQQHRLDESLELEIPPAWPATLGTSFASGW